MNNQNLQLDARKTRYPYNRIQCAMLFRKQFRENQKMYKSRDCYLEVNQALAQMQKYGYSVRVSDRIDDETFRTARKVKLKFYCQGCQHPFTSIVGTFQIIASIRSIIKSKKATIAYKIKIFRMNCMKCNQFCQPKIYQSQLNAMFNTFCLIVSQMIEHIPAIRHKDGRYKSNIDVHKHEQQYCQACQLGKCFNIRKQDFGQRYQNQTTKWRNSQIQRNTQQKMRKQISEHNKQLIQEKQRQCIEENKKIAIERSNRVIQQQKKLRIELQNRKQQQQRQQKIELQIRRQQQQAKIGPQYDKKDQELKSRNDLLEANKRKQEQTFNSHKLDNKNHPNNKDYSGNNNRPNHYNDNDGVLIKCLIVAGIVGLFVYLKRR